MTSVRCSYGLCARRVSDPSGLCWQHLKIRENSKAPSTITMSSIPPRPRSKAPRSFDEDGIQKEVSSWVERYLASDLLRMKSDETDRVKSLIDQGNLDGAGGQMSTISQKKSRRFSPEWNSACTSLAEIADRQRNVRAEQESTPNDPLSFLNSSISDSDRWG